MTHHYYGLAGDSLKALNRLIEIDGLRSDVNGEDFWETLKDIAPAEKYQKHKDEIAEKKKLLAAFTAAQVSGHQAALGFSSPCGHDPGLRH